MLSCVISCLTFQGVKAMSEQHLSKPQPIVVAQSGNQFLCLAESEGYKHPHARHTDHCVLRSLVVL